MRILYVAKHGPQDNCDEDAIAHTLEQLGHEVVKVHELRRHRTEDLMTVARRGEYDFCLFHKWETVSEIAEVSRIMPCAFFYFDLLSNDDDPSLAARMRVRRRWFNDVSAHCVAGFCTDGDWVERWNTAVDRHGAKVAKAYWLMQGADERFVGLGTEPEEGFPDVLFTGTRFHGRKREEHIRRLEERYGRRFGVIGESKASPRRHGRDLANLFASVKVVVAPDGPCTDRYWSNRVYLTLGLGGFLLHPDCKGLRDHYHPADLTYYGDRQHLTELIDRYLDDSEHRQGMRERGLKVTIERNLYRHRCEKLVAEVKELL